MKYALISIFLVLDVVAFYFLLRNFLNIKKRAKEDYPLYLVMQYNSGLITKHQVDTQDMSLFKKFYKESTRRERLFKLVILCGLLGVFISLIVSFFVV